MTPRSHQGVVVGVVPKKRWGKVGYIGGFPQELFMSMACFFEMYNISVGIPLYVNFIHLSVSERAHE